MKNLILLLALFSSAAHARIANQVYVMPNSGNVPTWGQVDLSQSAAVKNVLPFANGGTGLYNAGTVGQHLTSTGSALVLATPNGSQSNIGLTASVAANALTINLVQAGGALACSSANPCETNFRGTTATNGSFNAAAVTGSLGITIPSGATLGQTAGIDQYVWVYLTQDTSIDICVTGGIYLAQESLYQGFAISSGATSNGVLYCASGHSSAKPIRLIGRIRVNEASAGTWASAPEEIQLLPTVVPNVGEWYQYTPTFTGLGTVTGINVWSRRNGNMLELKGSFAPGTATAATVHMSLGYNGVSGGIAVDSNSVNSTNCAVLSAVMGTFATLATGANSYNMLACGGNFTVEIGVQGSSSAGSAPALGTSLGSTTYLTFTGSVPIAGWTAYGP